MPGRHRRRLRCRLNLVLVRPHRRRHRTSRHLRPRRPSFRNLSATLLHTASPGTRRRIRRKTRPRPNRTPDRMRNHPRSTARRRMPDKTLSRLRRRTRGYQRLANSSAYRSTHHSPDRQCLRPIRGSNVQHRSAP